MNVVQSSLVSVNKPLFNANDVNYPEFYSYFKLVPAKDYPTLKSVI